MKKYIQVQSNERVVVFRSGSLTEPRWSVDVLSFLALAEVRAALPGEWFGAVKLASHERSIPMHGPLHVTIVEPHGLVTRDEAIVRYTITSELAVHAARPEAVDSVRAWVQLASRELAAAMTRDELLDGKDVMIQFLRADVGPRARALGIDLVRVGVQESAWSTEVRPGVLTLDPACPDGVAGWSLPASRARRRSRWHSCCSGAVDWARPHGR